MGLTFYSIIDTFMPDYNNFFKKNKIKMAWRQTLRLAMGSNCVRGQPRKVYIALLAECHLNNFN